MPGFKFYTLFLLIANTGFSELTNVIYPAGAAELKAILKTAPVGAVKQNFLLLTGNLNCYGGNLRAVRIPLQASSELILDMFVTDDQDFQSKRNNVLVNVVSRTLQETSNPQTCSFFTPIDLSNFKESKQIDKTNLTKMAVQVDTPEKNAKYYKTFEAYYRDNSWLRSMLTDQTAAYSLLKCMKTVQEDELNLLSHGKTTRINATIPAATFIGTESTLSPRIIFPLTGIKSSFFEGTSHSLKVSMQIETPKVIYNGEKDGRYSLKKIPYQVKGFRFYQTNDLSVGSKLEGSHSALMSANGTIKLTGDFPGDAKHCGSYYSPLMLFFDNRRPSFTGSSHFPLDPLAREIFWPEKNAAGYFLAKRSITRHNAPEAVDLFGNQGVSNGFQSLSAFDSNSDQSIDQKDPAFQELVLWKDSNSNGRVDTKEILELAEKGVTAISLKYDNSQVRQMGSRAELRESSTFKFLKNNRLNTGTVIDVWFNLYE